MLNKFRMSRRSIAISCALATIIVWGAMGALEPVTAVGSAARLAVFMPKRYGVIYLYSGLEDDWEPEDVPAMEAALQRAQDMGLTTVVQVFPSWLIGSGNESRWLPYLDVAEQCGIKVVGYLWPNNLYTEDPDAPFDYSDLKAFLDVVGDHPALIGYVALHQPVELGITDEQLRTLYAEMKSYAPHLKLAHFMANIAYWDEHGDDWAFSDGMCDICMIWYFPFRYIDGSPVYENEIVLSVVQSNVALLNERDPDAELWFLGQAFEQSSHQRNLRMPTPDEMVALYLDVMQEPVDGFMWYPWTHGDVYDARLGDEGMEDHQEAVIYIAETYFRSIYLPLIMMSPH